MNIDEIIARLHVLPATSQTTLKALVKEVSYPKGHMLLEADKVERNIYFIRKGIVRAYADRPKGQVTFWFGLEGDIALSIKSYTSNQKSYESIELLEDCELYEININKLKKGFEEDIDLANWGRKLAEYEMVRTEQRLIDMQFKTAQERYSDLLANQPELLLRVPLGHIASYLGISQVSLSRIRADLR